MLIYLKDSQNLEWMCCIVNKFVKSVHGKEKIFFSCQGHIQNLSVLLLSTTYIRPIL